MAGIVFRKDDYGVRVERRSRVRSTTPLAWRKSVLGPRLQGIANGTQQLYLFVNVKGKSARLMPCVKFLRLNNYGMSANQN